MINAPFTNADGSEDAVNMYRLDLVGNTYDRGFAHGALLAKEIAYFTEVGLNKYYMDMVLDLDISQFPEPLREILHIIQIRGALAAPAAFNAALDWVYQAEIEYLPENLVQEMEGIGAGICYTFGPQCNTTEWTNVVKRVNMLPELIRMACTAFGAWGPASETGKLMQVRALDFGGGPFANYTVLGVYRNAGERSFASIAFPGMVGVITGVAQDGIGISEKVWMTYDTPSLQPGSYDGEPDVFVLRDILQYSKTREEAEAYMRAVRRTWAIFVGVGDFATQRMDIIGYKQDSLDVYNDVTMPSVTGQPYLDSIVYVDKHPQPTSEGPTGTLPTALTDFYGNMSLPNARVVVQYHKTGDLHIAMYDFGENSMIVSIGRTNEDGDYGPIGGDLSSWKAYNRPYVKFDLDDLWAGI